MKTLEQLQRDMDTTTDLREIVRTMKVLAAVSIRQYERAQESLQHYNRSVELGLRAVMKQRFTPFPAAAGKNAAMVGAIVFGSDHGLCGRYNETIAAYARRELDKWAGEGRRIVVVGSRVEAILRSMGQRIEDCFWVPGTVGHITGTVQKILLHIDEWRQQDIERVILFHHARQGRSHYPPAARQLLPVDVAGFQRQREKTWPSRSLPQYTLPTEQLLRTLIRQHLFGLLFNACAESLAGEHASRLMSMQVAEKNIQQRLEALTASYRQQRQDQITEELLDVVSGFEAMQED